MIKTLMIATALVATTPALAADNSNFTGVRIEATAGYDNVLGDFDKTDVVYGAAAGLDIPLGSRFTIGAEANTSNVFEDQRKIGAAARLGFALSDNLLVYAKGGYDNYRNSFSKSLDGATFGGGLEYKIGKITYIKAEGRYSDFAQGTGSVAAVAGVGVRF